MNLSHRLRTSGYALLAVLLAAAGAPAVVCAAMPDCPMMTPASGCHESGASSDSCDSTRLDRAMDCCTVSAQPAPAAAQQAPTWPSGFELASASQPVAPVAAPIAGEAVEAPPGGRPAGRVLLSLHQTLLI